MAFRVWTSFLVFIGIMLLLLWMLQITFLEPYYKISREKNVSIAITEVEKILQEDLDDDTRLKLRLLFARENMCGVVYNQDNSAILNIAVDIIGPNCYVNNISQSTKEEYIDLIKTSDTKDISVPFRNEYFEQAMQFYGKEIMVQGDPHYIFVNSPLKLLDSTVEVLKNQFLLVSTIIFGIGTSAAILLSRKLAYPIHAMNESAKKLARGDFDVKFKGEGYSEAIQLSETLNYATEEFSKTDELRRDLVANVSHDIKTPLTMIKAYAEMILDISGNDEELRNSHLNVILDETNHLERLVNDMLSLSQFESKVLEINETVFNLRRHVNDTLNLFQGLDFEYDIKVNKRLYVQADEVKMGQVLYNFVNNAIKHSNASKKIKIEAKQINNKTIEVSVIDYGEGISKENQKYIWDRYAKINKHHTRSSKTTGLGLSIVSAICEATGSDYGVESEIGKGSRFYYTLKLTKRKT